MEMPSDKMRAPSPSVSLAAEKARTQRVERLTKNLEGPLGDPLPTLDALMTELGEGASHPELWERLHAAAARDDKLEVLADTYKKSADGARMKRLSGVAQAEMLMRAADFFQGMLGDQASAAAFLARVIGIAPEHEEAFSRLERFLEKQGDKLGLLELYAKVGAAAPRRIAGLGTRAEHRLHQLGPRLVLADDACRRLVALVPTNARLLDALDAHCRATKRYTLAVTLVEEAIAGDPSDEDVVVQRRRRLVQLCMHEASSPELAMPHVEALLARDPFDAAAWEAAEKLLGVRAVASRAAAAIREARRVRAGGAA